jgi:hypothetical protein
MYVLGPTYHVDPVLKDADTHEPAGKFYDFALQLKGSKYYDCTAATGSATYPPRGGKCLPFRNVTVYIPAAYKDGAEVGVLVQQDGPGYNHYLIPIMDALINHPDPARSLPVFISVSVSTGTTGDGTGSLRDNQYDTMSGKYATFVDDEVFAAVRSNPAIQADFPRLNITSDSDGRCTIGCSSGAMAAFTMAWFRPDLFRRVVAYSAMLVRKDCALPSNVTYPFGGWEYADLIRSSPKKPLRIFHAVTNRDLGTHSAPPYAACAVNLTSGTQTPVTATEGCFSFPGVCKGTPAEGRYLFPNLLEPVYHWCDPPRSNAPLSNNNTAAALEEKGYETRFAYALSRCHCDLSVLLQDLPSTLVWAWRGWKGSAAVTEPAPTTAAMPVPHRDTAVGQSGR